MTTSGRPLVLSCAQWGDNVSFIQGAKYDGESYFVYQADPGPGGEDLIIRLYNTSRQYQGYLRVPNGGHASTAGVTNMGKGVSRHLIPAGAKGIFAVNYRIGNSGTPSKKYYPHVGYCSAVAVNNSNEIIVARKGGAVNTITWLPLESVMAGEKPPPILRYSFRTPAGVRFQGHYNWLGVDYYAWESDPPKRNSRNYHTFITWYERGKYGGIIDTTAYLRGNSEPQGFMVNNNGLHFVKRYGGNNSKRTVVCFPLTAKNTVATAVQPTVRVQS